MLWQIVLLISGILCLLYYAVLCFALRKWDSTFSRFWLACGICCLFLQNVYTAGEEMSRVFRTLLSTFIMLLAAVFVLTELKIIHGMFPGKYREYPYLIVLGAQVDGRIITDSLRRRLDCALSYLKAHPKSKVIVSGGMGKKEAIPEAEAMAEYLLVNGIERERILKENRSRTTKENLIFSQMYIEDNSQSVGIVSNNFHLYRAVCYAKQAGYVHPYPVAADCHPLLLPNYIVREFFAVWKMWLVRVSAVFGTNKSE